MKLLGWLLLAAIIIGGLIVVFVEIVWIAIMAAVSIVLAGAIWLMVGRMRKARSGDE